MPMSTDVVISFSNSTISIEVPEAPLLSRARRVFLLRDSEPLVRSGSWSLRNSFVGIAKHLNLTSAAEQGVGVLDDEASSHHVDDGDQNDKTGELGNASHGDLLRVVGREAIVLGEQVPSSDFRPGNGVGP